MDSLYENMNSSEESFNKENSEEKYLNETGDMDGISKALGGNSSFDAEIKKPLSNGSVVFGLIGAILGALVGSLPWIFGIVALEVYYGVFAFVIVIASFYGYKLFRGKKNIKVAYASVLIPSLLMVYVSEIIACYVRLCEDEIWIMDAEINGISVQELVFNSLIHPENMLIILKESISGYMIALIGFAGISKIIKRYVDVEDYGKLGKKANGKNISYVNASIKQIAIKDEDEANKRVENGASIPNAYVVRLEKETLKNAYIAIPSVIVILIVGAIFFIADGIFWPAGILAAMAVLVGFVLPMVQRQIKVEGCCLEIRNCFFKKTKICISDIKKICYIGTTWKIIDKEGKVLGKIEPGMENTPILLQQLKQAEIEFD